MTPNEPNNETEHDDEHEEEQDGLGDESRDHEHLEGGETTDSGGE